MLGGECGGAGGAGILLQLGRLILRARSSSPAPHNQRAGTSQQVLIQTQPKVDEEDARLEDSFQNHINALWTEHVPICVEVLLGPPCSECYATMASADERAYPLPGLLLERWTMSTVLDRSESPAAISPPWLLNAVRSQLHFSQLAAWRATPTPAPAHSHATQRRRKLSRETNIKKIEPALDRKLNVLYSIKSPNDCTATFAKPPTDHTFPLTDLGGKYLKVVLESLPRLEDVPEVACACVGTVNTDELVGKLNDLSIGCRKFDGAINSNIGTPTRRLSIISNPGSTEFLFTIDKDKLVDDRMHTPCSENGKHKCICDEESDSKASLKKLDERRLKEIAKYKRRIRKEKTRKFCDSTSSEGEKKETTSIPILQASRFDRFRAIGCYRNQTYLTLPASRIETRSPFIDTDTITPPEKTKTVATQTDFACSCGSPLEVKCDNCIGMVRSDANYNLFALQESGVRRKLDDSSDKSLKKQKCDNLNSVNSCNDIIKRPKLRRFYPIVNKLEKIVTDRNHSAEKDMQDLHLDTEDSVFSTAKESKINDGQFPMEPKGHIHKELKNGSIDVSNTGSINEHKRESNLNGHISKESNDFLQNYDRRTIKESIRLQNTNEEQFLTESKRLQNTNEGQFLTESNRLQNMNKGQFLTESKRLQNMNEGQFLTESKRLQNMNEGQFLTESKRLQCTNEGRFLPKSKLSQAKENILDTESRNTQNDDHLSLPKESKRQKTFSISDDDFVVYEKCDYGTIDRHEIESPKEEHTGFKFSIPEQNVHNNQPVESLKDEFVFTDPNSSEVPSPSEMDRFRWRFDPAASMVFHSKTGLPLTSSPAPLRRGNSCFDFDDSINGISGIKSALFQPISPVPAVSPVPRASPVRREGKKPGSSGLLGSFEESALQGRLEGVATVHGFTAELGASGAFCPPHKRLPVTVTFYAPGGTAAPYMGHISLGPGGYRVARSGSVQVSLFNPHGTLVKMFVVVYDLSRMPPAARTFLRQRTLHQAPQATRLRYLIHLRFMTSKSGKLYLHTDIRLIVSRKADLDTAAAHSALIRPLSREEEDKRENAPNRVFGGSSDHDSERSERGYDSSSVYELRSITYAPDNPKYSPR